MLRTGPAEAGVFTLREVDDLRESVDEVGDALPNLVACILGLHREQQLNLELLPGDRSNEFREPEIPEICEQMRTRARRDR